MSRAFKTIGTAAVAALSLGLSALPASATPAFELVRKAGADRYLTATTLAGEAFTTATNAVVVRGDGPTANFADALAGSYLAGGVVSGGAPIVLTGKGSVPQTTLDLLSSRGVTNVTILGGTSAVSTAVQSRLAQGRTVDRIEGADRFDTAAQVARELPADQIGQVGGKRAAFLANGRTLVDALAAGPIAFNKRIPILLTEAGTLPPQTASAITAMGITHVVELGGTGVVSAAVDTAVKALGATTQRIDGADRYDTAAKLADFALASLTGFSTAAVDVASGVSIADALAGGPAAGKLARPIVLVNSTSVPKPTSDWLAKQAGTLTSGRVFGGTLVVPDVVVTAAETAGKGAGSNGDIVAVDTTAKQYTFLATGATAPTTVAYAATDTFSVDGTAATLAAFEAAITPGDKINYINAGTTASHALTNVDPASITSGVVGNVDTADNQYAIIEPVTGAVLNGTPTYGAGNTYVIDGATGKTEAQFEADLNEGDHISLTGTAITLTNTDVVGTANTITKPAVPLLVTNTQLKIGALGDIATAGSGESGEQDGNDDRYEANGGNSGDLFVIDGQTGGTWSDFNDALSVGDTVTYRRVAGVETFTLVNVAPATFTGQAVGDLDADGGGLPFFNDNDGGSFTLATAAGPVPVTYASGGALLVNGLAATEAEFEAAYSAGDTVSFRAADASSGTTQRLELTDANLAGPVQASSVNTADTAATNPDRPANSFNVLATNGTTVLDTVAYTDTAGGVTNAYTVNGATAALAQFETELAAVAAATKTGTVTVTRSGTAVTYALTTTAT